MSLTTRSMRDLELSTFCIVPHFFFSSSFCQSLSPLVLASNQASILSSEPRLLIDVPRLINQIEHNPVFNALTEFVGVDVAAEDFQAGLLVLFQQRRAGEADEDSIGHHRLHHAVQFAALRAVAFVHEDKHLAHGLAGLRFQLLNERIEVVYVLPAELVDQRAQQARRGLAKLVH